MHKLQHDFNFQTDTIRFFNSYFLNRQQTTHTQHARSSTQTITHGIPQGSTLSTTFFLLYINDIINTVPQSSIYTYADDTTLVIADDNLSKLQERAQAELNSLVNYFHNNNLVPNSTKTNFSVFCPHRARSQAQGEKLTLEMNGGTLEQKSKAKLLGMYVQEDLKYQRTVNDIVRKLQPLMQSFRYANKLLSTNTMRKLYYTHVYPHLIGHITVWGTKDKSKVYMTPLIQTHKRIMRLIKNAPPRTHTKPIMSELRILNLNDLYILRVCTEMHPFIYPKKPLNRPEHNHKYTSAAQVHEHDTRFSARRHIYVPYANREGNNDPAHGAEHFTRAFAHIWNSIPEAIRKTESLETFKAKLAEMLLQS